MSFWNLVLFKGDNTYNTLQYYFQRWRKNREKVSHNIHGVCWTIFLDTISKGKSSTKIKNRRCFIYSSKPYIWGSRLFKESDGYEEVIISKVVKWINTSNPSEVPTEFELNKTPVSNLKIRMKNGDIAVIEPAYNCIFENQKRHAQ